MKFLSSQELYIHYLIICIILETFINVDPSNKDHKVSHFLYISGLSFHLTPLGIVFLLLLFYFFSLQIVFLLFLRSKSNFFLSYFIFFSFFLLPCITFLLFLLFFYVVEIQITKSDFFPSSFFFFCMHRLSSFPPPFYINLKDCI